MGSKLGIARAMLVLLLGMWVGMPGKIALGQEDCCPGIAHRPGQVLILFEKGTLRSDAEAIIADVGATVLRPPPDTPRALLYYLVSVPVGSEDQYASRFRVSPELPAPYGTKLGAFRSGRDVPAARAPCYAMLSSSPIRRLRRRLSRLVPDSVAEIAIWTDAPPFVNSWSP